MNKQNSGWRRRSGNKPEIVARDGHFWIQIVPLADGNNGVIVMTAQDIMNNPATMSLAVTGLASIWRVEVNQVFSSINSRRAPPSNWSIKPVE